MNRPDIQYFDQDGTWVKPEGAVRIDVIAQFGDASLATRQLSQWYPRDPRDESTASYDAAAVPATVEVTVSEAGWAMPRRPGVRDRYVLVITHLADGEAP